MLDYLIFSQVNLAWLIALASILFAIFLYSRMRRNNISRRVNDLSVAKDALKAHYAAVQIVLDDPAPSQELKHLFCKFSEAITDEKFAIFMAEMARSGKLFESRLSPELSKIYEERLDLESRNPELKKAFSTATESGIVAVFIRWPSTARYFASVISEIAADERKGLQISQRAERYSENDVNDESSGNNGIMMPA